MDDPLAHLAVLNRQGAPSVHEKMLAIGSDIEIAGRVKQEICQSLRRNPSCRRSILALLRHTLGGDPGTRVTACGSRVRWRLLQHPRWRGIARQTQQVTGQLCSQRVCCVSGGAKFLRYSVSRHQLRFRVYSFRRAWNAEPRRCTPGTIAAGIRCPVVGRVDAACAPPQGSLLARLLDGMFHGDDEADAKVALLAEIIGAAALGYATKLQQPRAVILRGETAENGKSQVLDLARGLLPPSAVCSLTAARMADERHIVGLVGKLLNASDELTSAAAIASEMFKAVITGEPVHGRDVYKSRVEFRPVAQHLFATNILPVFAGGMDRGIQRRLLVIPFNRVVPPEERIEAIGRRVAEQEADLLLAWAVHGAARLIRQRNFSVPASSKTALMDWIYGADPVLAWLDERVEVRPDERSPGADPLRLRPVPGLGCVGGVQTGARCRPSTASSSGLPPTPRASSIDGAERVASSPAWWCATSTRHHCETQR